MDGIFYSNKKKWDDTVSITGSAQTKKYFSKSVHDSEATKIKK